MPLEKTVKEFMHPLSHYEYIGENEPVEQALKLIASSKRKGRKLPIIIVVGQSQDEPEVVQGIVSSPEIVFGIADHFLKGVERIGPIFWEGQLSSECVGAFHKTVREIMTPIKSCINETERIMEAIFLLNKHQVNTLPVVRQKEVVGMIHLEDILDAIAGFVLE